MTPAYPQWAGFPLPFPRSLIPRDSGRAEVPDHHTQLEELFGHVRRCEKWARLDDRIDLDWKLQGKS